MNNNRKIPPVFFLLGIINCMIRFFPVGAIGLICTLIGLIFGSVITEIGIALLIFWILVSIIEEIQICYTIKANHDNEELNEIFDKMFGEDKLMEQVLKGEKDASRDILNELTNNKKGDDKDEE
ncbi:MAG: hypothetical protein ACI4F4_09740 [Lachnospiraceae bacterium]